jgi:hypothetical protein
VRPRIHVRLGRGHLYLGHAPIPVHTCMHTPMHQGSTPLTHPHSRAAHSSSDSRLAAIRAMLAGVRVCTITDFYLPRCAHMPRQHWRSAQRKATLHGNHAHTSAVVCALAFVSHTELAQQVDTQQKANAEEETIHTSTHVQGRPCDADHDTLEVCVLMQWWVQEWRTQAREMRVEQGLMMHSSERTRIA